LPAFVAKRLVVGHAEHGETRRAIRTTLVSLAVAAQRVRYLAERGEIEVDDLPPPAVPPTPAKVN
jgi:hypothetical protein